MEQKNWYFMESRFRAISHVMMDALTLDLIPEKNIVMLRLESKSGDFDFLVITLTDLDKFDSQLCWYVMKDNATQYCGVLSDSTCINEDLIKIYSLVSMYLKNSAELITSQGVFKTY